MEKNNINTPQNNIKILKNYVIIVFLTVFGLAVDLVLKTAFTGKYYGLIDGVISIFYTENTGAGFSVLSNSTTFLTILTAGILLALIVVNVFIKPQSKAYAIGMGLVIAGAVGNLVDRIFLGYVRDFVKLEFMDFPIFNLADVCLTVGAVVLCCVLLFFKQEKKVDNE